MDWRLWRWNLQGPNVTITSARVGQEVSQHADGRCPGGDRGEGPPSGLGLGLGLDASSYPPPPSSGCRKKKDMLPSQWGCDGSRTPAGCLQEGSMLPGWF